MANATMLDIAKLNGNDPVVGLIEENLKYSPEVEVFPFRTIRGTSYKTGIRTALPTTGFRNANEGQASSKSTFRQDLVECFIFGGNVKADVAVAAAHEDGAEVFKAIEASGVMRSAMINIGKQVFYGVTQDSKGFPGLKAATPFGGTTLAGDALTVDAAGTTASTASSVYLVKFGAQDVTMIGGQSTTFDLGPWFDQLVKDDDGTNEYLAHVAALNSWLGLQIGHENCVRRIANLTADNGKGLTDALLASALATFPVGFAPDAIFMSRRSRSQLQTSRTVTLFGNGRVRADQPAIAPIPTEYEGIPIYATDSILNTDAIES